jgi:hypothetical protein
MAERRRRQAQEYYNVRHARALVPQRHSRLASAAHFDIALVAPLAARALLGVHAHAATKGAQTAAAAGGIHVGALSVGEPTTAPVAFRGGAAAGAAQRVRAAMVGSGRAGKQVKAGRSGTQR